MHRLTRAVHRPTTVLWLTMLGVSSAWATDGSTPPEWTLSPDGTSLVQRSNRLVWPRCVEGMRWTGKDCIGEPMLMTHTEAQALARTRAQAEGMAWRLPHLKELQQLTRQGTQKPATGTAWVPESAQGWCWSGTAAIDIRTVNVYSYDNVMKGLNGQNVNQMKFLHGWVVNTGTGESRNDVLKRTPMMVRLVRPAD